MRRRTLVLGLTVLTAACGGSVFEEGGTGGAGSAFGGQQAVGGATYVAGSGGASSWTGGQSGIIIKATGGMKATGGRLSTGGTSAYLSKATGGKAAAGGSKAFTSGGGKASGGITSSGGSKATGGKAAMGGASSTAGGSKTLGGALATGGTRATGGTPLSTGGASGDTGGAMNTGGEQATGGIGDTGGTPSVGGTSQTGGSSATGGSSQIGGNSSVDQRPGAPCQTVDDCQLLNDCCSCDVYSAGATPPQCNTACKQPMCDVMGLGSEDVACVAGRCVFSRSCDLSAVLCEVMEPQCGDGQVPSARDNCYGPCLPVGRCGKVASCDVCTAAGLECVTLYEMGGTTYHCVLTPLNCSAEPTCDCMGVCSSGFVCGDPGSQELTCSCPFC